MHSRITVLLIRRVCDLAKENYLAEIEKRGQESAIDENWGIPEFVPYSS